MKRIITYALLILLCFAGTAFACPKPNLKATKLDHQPQVEKVIRNLPIRTPLIWL